MKRKLKNELSLAFKAPIPIKKKTFLNNIRKSSPGIGHLLILQLFHMEKSSWIINLLLFTGTVMSGRKLQVWESRENIGVLLLWLPLWSLMLFREELHSALCGMEELEQSCTYCALEVLIGRLFWTGVMQILMLGTSGILLAETPAEFAAVLIYFPVPWLAVSLLCLIVLSVCERQQALWYCLGVTVLIGALLLASLELYPQIYNVCYQALWFAAAVVLATLNMAQIRKFKKRMEDSIWSLQ